MRTRIAHAVVVLVGLVILAYPFTVGATPDVSCRGQAMAPGDTCLKADGKSTQSYEQRAGDARNARPIIVVVGLLVTGFGASLLVTEVRRTRRREDAAAR